MQEIKQISCTVTYTRVNFTRRNRPSRKRYFASRWSKSTSKYFLKRNVLWCRRMGVTGSWRIKLISRSKFVGPDFLVVCVFLESKRWGGGEETKRTIVRNTTNVINFPGKSNKKLDEIWMAARASQRDKPSEHSARPADKNRTKLWNDSICRSIGVAIQGYPVICWAYFRYYRLCSWKQWKKFV